MAQTVRHQVFLSSTFTDLKEERAEVIQALWEMDCIPTGMEAFIASNEGQWEVIKRVIDDSDYYVLIIGGRYGSVTKEGMSYTEKEYDYARSLDVPVLAFVHGEPENIAVGKSDTSEDLRVKLNAFRARVMAEYPIRKWTTAPELGGLVSRSIVREIKFNARPRWVRNDGVTHVELLERINALTTENAELRDSADSEDIAQIDETLEHGDDIIELAGTRIIKPHGLYLNRFEDEWAADVSWNGIWRGIGPMLLNEATELQMKSAVGRFNFMAEVEDEHEIDDVRLSSDIWNEILIQFRALGYIVPGSKKRAVSDGSSYWKITPREDRQLVTLLARKRESL